MTWRSDRSAVPARNGGLTGTLGDVLRAVWHSGSASTAALSDGERAAMLRDAGAALRLGRLADALATLRGAGGQAASDAAGLNFLGVLCEARGESAAAKRYYGRAFRADRTFGPAQQNMRRMYELNALRRTTRGVAVGDPLTDVWLARISGPRHAAR
jgi:hypothetical protein